MDIKEIIRNLEHYNNWRRDDDNKYTMPDPKQIGITIDAAISELKKSLTHDVVCIVCHTKLTDAEINTNIQMSAPECDVICEVCWQQLNQENYEQYEP